MTQDPLYTMEDPSTETGPRPFSEIPPLWFQVFSMHEDFFASELPRASSSNVALSVLVLAGAAALVTLGVLMVQGYASSGASLCGGLGGGLVGGFVSFYVSTGLVHHTLIGNLTRPILAEFGGVTLAGLLVVVLARIITGG